MLRRNHSLSRQHRSAKRAWLAALLWTTLIGLSLAWNARNEYARVLELAKAQARANLNKDKAFRLWATSMGGFYIPISEHTQPSPYLGHLPFRDITTVDGKVLTLFNPATVIKQIGEQFQELSGISAKITNKVYLNPENAPDPWELKALDRFEEGASEIAEETQIEGNTYLRMIHPMKMEPGCLKCHTGKAGGLGGGTGVAIPLAPYREIADGAVVYLAATHGGIWSVGLALIGFIVRRTRRYERERGAAENELRLAASVFHNAAEGILITDENNIIVNVNAAFSDVTGFRAEEVLGCRPSILKSGRHDSSFYEQMWSQLLTTGTWQGELWDKRKTGEIYPKWQCINTVRDETGKITNYVAIFRDISEIKQREEQLWHLAHFDPLCNLANRSLMYASLHRAMLHSKRDGHLVAIILIDLDHFKEVNDTFGHDAGDQLLVHVAQQLTNTVRENDTVARLGGDEFAVILEKIGTREDIALVAAKISHTLQEPVNLTSGPVLSVGASMGIAIYPWDGDEIDILMKNADRAMYRAKETGKNNHQFFENA